MTKVWILTLFLYGGIHHYCDGCVYASQERCETVLDVMRASYPNDPQARDSMCREIWIQGIPK